MVHLVMSFEFLKTFPGMLSMKKSPFARLMSVGLPVSLILAFFVVIMQSSEQGRVGSFSSFFNGSSKSIRRVLGPAIKKPSVKGYVSLAPEDMTVAGYFASAAQQAGDTMIAPVGMPVSIAASSCTDTDGGTNEMVQGSMTYSGYNQTLTDYCEPDGQTLLEYSCPFGQESEIVCQRGCSNGACISDAQLRCVDNDGGLDWTKKSTIQLYQNDSLVTTKEDTCELDSSTTGQVTPMKSCIGTDCTIREYGCTPYGNESDLLRNCETNGCVDGVCLDAPSATPVSNIAKDTAPASPATEPPLIPQPQTQPTPTSTPVAQSIDPNSPVVSQRYKSIVEIKTYVINPYGFLTLLDSGSGVIIDQRGIVLTNAHVVHATDSFGKFKPATYLICIPTNIDQEPKCNYRADLIRYEATLDLALLRIEPIDGLSLPTSFDTIPLMTNDTTVIGDDLYAVGYPSIGEGSITATKGTVSGKLKKYDVNWIKTDAVISFGSSGGAALDKNGSLIGLTTAGRSDFLGSLGYVIQSSSIAPWVQQYINTDPRQEAISSRMSQLAQTMRDVETASSIGSPVLPFTIDKPAGWDATFDGEHIITIKNGASDSGGMVNIVYYRTPFPYSPANIIPEVKRDLLTTGGLFFATIDASKDIVVNGIRGKKITLSGSYGTQSLTVDKYVFVFGNNIVNITAQYGDGDQDIDTINSMIQSFTATANSSNPLPQVTTFSQTDPKMSLSTSKDWAVSKLVDASNPAFIDSKKFPDARISVRIHETDRSVAAKGNQGLLDYYVKNIQSLGTPFDTLGFQFDISKKSANVALNSKLRKVVLIESSLKNSDTNETIAQSVDYLIPAGAKHVEVELLTITKDAKVLSQAKQAFTALLRTLVVQP